MPMKGIELRKHRKQLGLTQKQMAKTIGLHWNSLARMERDEIGISEPVVKLVRMIAAAKRKG